MKKIYTIAIFLFSVVITQAQFTVATHDGTPITDGSVFTFSELGTEAELTFDITNTGSSVIDMRLEFVSMTNESMDGRWLCVFQNCYPPNISVGTIFPTGGSSALTEIDPGETTAYGDHFYNSDPGDGTNYPIDYVFRIFEVGGNGDPITFTYRYDGTASVEDMTQVDFKLYPTITDGYVNLLVNEKVFARLINTQGQLIKQYNFESGIHTIDMSSFSKQMYYLVLTNQQGQQSLAKIIIK